MEIQKLFNSFAKLTDWIRDGFEDHRLVIRNMKSSKAKKHINQFFVTQEDRDFIVNNWFEGTITQTPNHFYDLINKTTHEYVNGQFNDITAQKPLRDLGENVLLISPILGDQFFMVREDLIIRL